MNGRVLTLNLHVVMVNKSNILGIHVFIRNWVIRKQYSAPQKVKKIQCWIFETSETFSAYAFRI